MNNLDQWLLKATEAAKQGGAILKQYWGNLSDIQEKGPGDLVTEADRFSEKAILKCLKEHFPTHQILAEESGQTAEASDFVWMVDPLDGTTNYAHQFPIVSVSIGLTYKQEPILGVVYNPIFEELFTAAKGLGAYLNGQSIHVSSVSDLSRSLLATGFAYDRQDNPDNNYLEFCHFTHLTQGVRRLGSAAIDLAYVACGKLDGFWERGLKPWDMAAGAILVQEAGGKISDYASSPLKLSAGRILATNGHLHSTISHELQHIAKRG